MVDNRNTTARNSSGGLGRRRFFALAAGGAAAAAGTLIPASAAQAHGDITSYPGIWGQRTTDWNTSQLKSYKYRPAFHDQLNGWLRFWFETTEYFEKPIRVGLTAAHDDNMGTAHEQGRAIDLAGLTVTQSSGGTVSVFQANYSVWKDLTGSVLAQFRRNYWATSASLHYHFRSVRTYPMGGRYRDSLHVDNLLSGSNTPAFNSSDKSQIFHVQASCRYIWGKGTTIDGMWNTESRRHAHEVLERIGKGGYIGDSKSHWQAFNRATLRKGYSTEEY